MLCGVVTWSSLLLQKHDRVRIIEKDTNKLGWWLGECNGRVGVAHCKARLNGYWTMFFSFHPVWTLSFKLCSRNSHLILSHTYTHSLALWVVHVDSCLCAVYANSICLVNGIPTLAILSV